jgi:hypothetical protein
MTAGRQTIDKRAIVQIEAAPEDSSGAGGHSRIFLSQYMHVQVIVHRARRACAMAAFQ